MAPQHTRAIVLRADPYRESSFLLHLLSEHHGMIHGIAKGMRKAKSGTPFVERGMLVETVIYLREHRDLHTCGSIQVLNFYAPIRADITTAALRDAACELLSRTVRQVEPHPELFTLASCYLDSLCQRGPLPRMLWAFYRDVAAALGFEMNLRSCVECGAALGSGGGALTNAKGGITCRRCRPARSLVLDLPDEIAQLLRGECGDRPGSLPASEIRRITRMLAGYCAFHCDITPEFKALDFLDDVWSPGRS